MKKENEENAIFLMCLLDEIFKEECGEEKGIYETFMETLEDKE